MMLEIDQQMACLGLSNGAVFQLVPQRFGHQIGVATGVVGAVGGLGGFLLPMVLGNIKQTTGSFSLGFVALAVMAVGAFLMLRILVTARADWRTSWRRAPVEAAASLGAERGLLPTADGS